LRGSRVLGRYRVSDIVVEAAAVGWELDLELIRGSFTGAEVHAGVVLAEGILVEGGVFGCSMMLGFVNGLSFERWGGYAAGRVRSVGR
jgi:hypothetical protein